MRLLDSLFGWKHKIRKLRKTWDRQREKSLGRNDPLKRILLEKLDMTESKLKTLEERRLSRIERSRLAKEIEINLAETRALLKATPEELHDYLEKEQKVDFSPPK